MDPLLEAIKKRRSISSYDSKTVSKETISWAGFGSMDREDHDIVQLLELKNDEKIFGPILIGHPKVSDPLWAFPAVPAELCCLK